MNCVTEKTHQGSVGLQIHAECKITVSNDWEGNTAVIAEDGEVELVKDFCYLASNVSRPGNCDKECKIGLD